MNLIPDEEGGNLYLINGNMTSPRGCRDICRQGGEKKKQKVLEFSNNLPDEETVLRFDGPIAEESWFGDKITPALFLFPNYKTILAT